MMIKDSLTAEIIRGPESWTFIYAALGFSVTIESTVISLITPLLFPYNIVVFLALAALTVWLFLWSASFQNKLIALKKGYENKAR